MLASNTNLYIFIMVLIILISSFYLISIKSMEKYRNIYNTDNYIDNFKAISFSPVILINDNFLTDEECSHIINLAEKSFSPSQVTSGENDVIDKNSRSSYSASIDSAYDDTIRLIEDRVSKLVGVDKGHIEPLQVVRYTKGQQFKPHFDFFDIKTDESRLKSGQRIHTFLIYLNTIPENYGGATVFPKRNIRIYPKKGRAVYFKNGFENGETDSLTLHGGEPILQDNITKYAVNIWIRNKKYI